MANMAKIRSRMQLVSVANSLRELGLAVQGDKCSGKFYGPKYSRPSNHAKRTLLTSLVCRAGRGEPSVLQELAVVGGNDRMDGGLRHARVPPEPRRPQARKKGTRESQNKKHTAPQKDRFRG